jgi:hypothetical protein
MEDFQNSESSLESISSSQNFKKSENTNEELEQIQNKEKEVSKQHVITERRGKHVPQLPQPMGFSSVEL